MTDAEKKVLDEEVVVESVDVEVGTMEDVDAIMKKFDRESNTRVWEGTPKKILRYVLAAFMLFMVYMNLWATWSGQIRRCLFVGFVILFTFFIYPVKKGNVKPNSMPWYDILLAVAGCIPYFYYVANFKRIVAMGIAIGQTEVILGIIGTLVLAECCRRAVGLPILVVAGCFVLYAFIGRGMSLDLVVYNIFYTTNGIIGTPISVCSTYIALFLLFGAFLEATGVANFFIDCANALVGWASGGPAEGRGRLLRPVRHGLRFLRRQHRYHRFRDHPDDEEDRLSPRVCRRGRGGVLHRRPDHAPHHGRCGVHHGGNDRL